MMGSNHLLQKCQCLEIHSFYSGTQKCYTEGKKNFDSEDIEIVDPIYLSRDSIRILKTVAKSLYLQTFIS